jgi:hypothetical protein
LAAGLEYEELPIAAVVLKSDEKVNSATFWSTFSGGGSQGTTFCLLFAHFFISLFIPFTAKSSKSDQKVTSKRNEKVATLNTTIESVSHHAILSRS